MFSLVSSKFLAMRNIKVYTIQCKKIPASQVNTGINTRPDSYKKTSYKTI
jgi:hypothetical protein